MHGAGAAVGAHARRRTHSEVRVIPDHQEVWVDSNDRSIIFEIVEAQSSVSDAGAPAFFWDDLADANDAKGDGDAQLEASEVIPDTAMPGLPGYAADGGGAAPGGAAPGSVTKLGLVGQQRVAKYREAARNTVRVYMLVLRIPGKGSEVLVHMNAPLAVDAASSSAALFPKDAAPEALAAAGLDVMYRLMATFTVVDWGLFGA